MFRIFEMTITKMRVSFLYVIPWFSIFSFNSISACHIKLHKYTIENTQETIYSVVDYESLQPNSTIIFKSNHTLRKIQSAPCLRNNETFFVRKCCLDKEIYSIVTRNCTSMYPDLYHEFMQKINTIEDIPTSSVDRTFVHSLMCAQNTEDVGTADEVQFLSNNDSVSIRDELVNVSNYCLEYLAEKGKLGVFWCHGNYKSKTRKYTVSLSINVMYSISGLFVLLTILVKFWIGNPTSLPGMTLLCHLITLFIYSWIFPIISIFQISPGNISCTLFGFLRLFIYLASFFWLNIMSFDIWWNFRPVNKFQKTDDQYKFTDYCICAWGCPLFITSVAILFNYCNFHWIYPDLKPNIGLCKCWFTSQRSEYTFCKIYIDLILIMNLFFFISTAINIRKERNNSLILQKGGNSYHKGPKTSNLDNEEHSRYRYYEMYARLFFIMGINRALFTTSISYVLPKSMNLPLSYLEALQGVWIFLAYICRSTVYISVSKKLYRKQIG